MSAGLNLARGLAFVLAGHAARRLPPERADWSEPMRYEVESIEGDFAALRWAVGASLRVTQKGSGP